MRSPKSTETSCRSPIARRMCSPTSRSLSPKSQRWQPGSPQQNGEPSARKWSVAQTSSFFGGRPRGLTSSTQNQSPGRGSPHTSETARSTSRLSSCCDLFLIIGASSITTKVSGPARRVRASIYQETMRPGGAQIPAGVAFPLILSRVAPISGRIRRISNLLRPVRTPGDRGGRSQRWKRPSRLRRIGLGLRSIPARHGIDNGGMPHARTTREQVR
jgi:hypothetical protein